MPQDLYRYTFTPDIVIEEVEAALVLALLSTEAIHGESQTRLDAGHALDRDKRLLVIDAATPVGVDLNRLFVRFMRRQLSEDCFSVERLGRQREEVTS